MKVALPFVVCLVVASGCAENRSPKVPILAVDALEVDLGAHVAGSKKLPAAEFHVTNKGEADLNVGPLRLHCGCANAEFLDDPLGPGESRRLIVTVKEANKYGPLSARVTIVSNDPVRPSFDVLISWSLLPPFVVEPEKIEWGEASGREVSQVVTLKPRVGGAPVVKQIDCQPKELTVKHFREDGVLRLTVAAPPSKLPARGDGLVRLTFEDRDVEPLTVPVSWRLADELVAVPNSVYLSNARTGHASKFSAFVRLESGKPFRLKSVTASNAAVRCVSPQGNELQTMARFDWLATVPREGSFVADVVIVVEADRVYERTIRIAGLVQ
jgi:hypothetical protein